MTLIEARLAGRRRRVSVGGLHEAKAVIPATGSLATSIPGVRFGGRVLDNWGA